MKLNKIVITGGPSAGKTTAMSWVQNAFTKLGYTVLFVPETATEFITGGVAPWTCGSNLDYQKVQMELQLTKERLFEKAARTMKADKILIVCDRGAIDNRAYMNDREFAEVLGEVGKTERELIESYDAVFHLVSAAKGAEEFYTLANNAARYETVSQAVEMDDRLIEAWKSHPHHYVIDNSVELREKLKKLIAQIREFLGEPAPFEIERKFLIEMPDLAALEKLPGCRRVEIEQAYLKTAAEKLEVEERLTQRAYKEMLEEAGDSLQLLHKTRYSLPWEGQVFQMNVYPFWQDKAIVKLELNEENALVQLPPMLQLIREVTGEREYKDYALAALE